MDILQKRIGRLPFLMMSLGIYVLAPLYFAHAWEHRTFWRYVTESQGFLSGFFRVLGDGVPCFFVHQAGAGVSLEMTAPFGLALMLVTLWRCNDCRASRCCLVLQCLPIASLFAFVYLSTRPAYRPRHRTVMHRREELRQSDWQDELDCPAAGHRHIA